MCCGLTLVRRNHPVMSQIYVVVFRTKKLCLLVLFLAECFVRVRSGQTLDHSVVKERLNMHSVGECELECLRSRYFTCRVFSFRY
jgi:hypothetical protein